MFLRRRIETNRLQEYLCLLVGLDTSREKRAGLLNHRVGMKFSVFWLVLGLDTWRNEQRHYSTSECF